MFRADSKLVTMIVTAGLLFSVLVVTSGNSGAALFGTDIMVNGSAAGSSTQSTPAMAVNGNDNIFVAWDDVRDGNFNIYVAASSDGGASFGTAVLVDNDAADQQRPDLATYGPLNVYVVWQDLRNGDWDIYFARSSNGGISFSTPVQVSDASAGSDQSYPSIAVASNGDIIVVWQDYRDNNWEIYSSISTDGGDSFGANVRVNNPSPTNEQRYPSVAFNSADAIFVAWQDDRGSDNDIYMGRSTNGGDSYQMEVRVSDGTNSEDQRYPRVAVDSNDYIHVVWEDYRSQSDWDVYSSRSVNNGNSFEENIRVHDVSSDNQRMPSLFIDSNDNLHVAWHDTRGGNSYIYYTRSTDAGESFGDDARVCSESAIASSLGSRVIVDSDMMPGVVWVDTRNGDNDVFFATGVNRAPTCTIISPSDSDTVSGTMTVSGSAADPDGDEELVRVEVRIDSGSWETASGTDSWSYTINTNSLSNGPHTLSARSYDGDIYSAEVSVSIDVYNPTNSAPDVSIWSPFPGAALTGSEAVISGNATDPDGDIIFSVQVRINDGNWQTATGTSNWAGWVYSLDTTTLSNGQHTIYARAYDGDLYTEPPVSVSVFISNAASNNAPLVAVTAPVAEEVITGSYIVEGTASDSDGNLQIVSVEVKLDNGTWIEAIPVADGGEWSAWVYYLDFETLAAGDHTITARSYDGTVYSAEASVTFSTEAGDGDGGNGLALLLLIVIIILLVLLILLMRRQKEKPDSGDGTQEDTFEPARQDTVYQPPEYGQDGMYRPPEPPTEYK